MSDQRSKQRALLVKARMYRLVSLIFAIMGLLVFAMMYFQNTQGDFVGAMRDPFFIVIVVFPFLPAAILSWMASRVEKKLDVLLESMKK